LNLKVYQSTQAINILFDGNKIATGVNVSTGGMPYTLNAGKEVIASAGAVS
jgi:choline dehydrogenase